MGLKATNGDIGGQAFAFRMLSLANPLGKVNSGREAAFPTAKGETPMGVPGQFHGFR